VGAFSTNFLMTLAAKLLTGHKKVRVMKWWHGGPPSSCKVGSERTKTDVLLFLSLLSTGSTRRAALPLLFLLMGRFVGFSPHGGDILHRSRWKLANFTLIGSGVLVYAFTGTKTLKISNITYISNIIAPKGRVSCTILTKFMGLYAFMRRITWSISKENPHYNMGSKY